MLMSTPWGYAATCPEFAWHAPPEMVQPDMVVQARAAMLAHDENKAAQLLSAYLREHPEGVFAEGARFASAMLPQDQDDRDNGFLMRIQRLERVRQQYPNSPYAPWALCWEGELYRQAGWYVEANAMFQQLLEQYPESPLAGRALLGAGRTYLNNQHYLEAALVFRRLVEEPQWADDHLEGALGLADATALSGAWQQAYYWYRVVEAEAPHLIRASVRSTYFFALAEWHVGDRWLAVSRFLDTVNLYPRQEEAGQALNRIGAHLLATGHTWLALWFFHEAAVRFEQQEPGRRGQMALIRWAATFLTQTPTKEERARVYDRMDRLEIYVPLSWDGVIETARALRTAPEPDLADEAKFLSARGYEELGDASAALALYGDLATAFHEPRWGEKAREQAMQMLTARVRAYHRRRAWVELIRFHDAQRQWFLLIPPQRDLMLMIAEAYREVHLPEEAIAWYDEVLKQYPRHPMIEELMAQRMRLAMDYLDVDRAAEYAEAYRQTFPQGNWIGDAAWILGLRAVRDRRFTDAIEQLTVAVQHATENELRVQALRERARAYRTIGQVEQAIADYQTIMADSTKTIDDEIALADLLFDQQAYARAARLYESLRKAEGSPDTAAWATFRLGLCQQELGDRVRARELLEHVLRAEIADQELERIMHRTARMALELLRAPERDRERVEPREG